MLCLSIFSFFNLIDLLFIYICIYKISNFCVQICVSLHLHFGAFFWEEGLFFPSLFAHFVLFGFVCLFLFYPILFLLSFRCLFVFWEGWERKSVNLGGQRGGEIWEELGEGKLYSGYIVWKEVFHFKTEGGNKVQDYSKRTNKQENCYSSGDSVGIEESVAVECTTGEIDYGHTS